MPRSPSCDGCPLRLRPPGAILERATADGALWIPSPDPSPFRRVCGKPAFATGVAREGSAATAPAVRRPGLAASVVPGDPRMASVGGAACGRKLRLPRARQAGDAAGEDTAPPARAAARPAARDADPRQPIQRSKRVDPNFAEGSAQQAGSRAATPQMRWGRSRESSHAAADSGTVSCGTDERVRADPHAAGTVRSCAPGRRNSREFRPQCAVAARRGDACWMRRSMRWTVAGTLGSVRDAVTARSRGPAPAPLAALNAWLAVTARSRGPAARSARSSECAACRDRSLPRACGPLRSRL